MNHVGNRKMRYVFLVILNLQCDSENAIVLQNKPDIDKYPGGAEYKIKWFYKFANAKA